MYLYKSTSHYIISKFPLENRDDLNILSDHFGYQNESVFDDIFKIDSTMEFSEIEFIGS